MPVINYWVTGNTANGLVNFLSDNLHGINRKISLSHPSAAIKSKVLNYLLTYFKDETVEVLKSTLADHYLDGIIVRDKSLVIVDSDIADETFTKVELDAQLPVNVQDLSSFHTLRQKAYNCYATGLSVHDDLEEIYIGQMDFEKADEFADQLITDLLENHSKKKKSGVIYHRLFGTNTADGTVNEVPRLIRDIDKVYYIKGRAGTGKSTFMKKLTSACAEAGYDVELYHCSFDPNSADMVLVRALNFCIFDSTDPHEFFPERTGEEIVDLYAELVAPGTDEKYADEINKLNNRYKSFMKDGNRYLKAAGQVIEQIEQDYLNMYNEEEIEKVSRNILNTI